MDLRTDTESDSLTDSNTVTLSDANGHRKCSCHCVSHPFRHANWKPIYLLQQHRHGHKNCFLFANCYRHKIRNAHQHIKSHRLPDRHTLWTTYALCNRKWIAELYSNGNTHRDWHCNQYSESDSFCHNHTDKNNHRIEHQNKDRIHYTNSLQLGVANCIWHWHRVCKGHRNSIRNSDWNSDADRHCNQVWHGSQYTGHHRVTDANSFWLLLQIRNDHCHHHRLATTDCVTYHHTNGISDPDSRGHRVSNRIRHTIEDSLQYGLEEQHDIQHHVAIHHRQPFPNGCQNSDAIRNRKSERHDNPDTHGDEH